MKVVRSALLLFAFALITTASGFAAEQECIPFDKAKEHVGEAVCVTGKIVSVGHSKSTWYLDFCENYKECPFVVVVFERDLKDPEKLKQLEGQTIRIFGPIKLYKDRPEIVLWHEHQLTGEPSPETAKERATAYKKKRDPMPPMPPGAHMGRRRSW
jgi:hypothetical protein